jgi:guanylate kinase
MSNKGLVIIISAPSGTGKTSICRSIFRQFPDIRFSVSYTTRQPRAGEVDGRDYHFITEDMFREKVQKGEFAEWAENYNHLYGTSRQVVEEIRSREEDLILDVEPRGAKALKELYPDGIFVFVLPPDLEELKKRLQLRGAEDGETRKRRFEKAKDEIREVFWYDYIIVNDRLESAVERLRAVYLAEKCRRERQRHVIDGFLKEA